MNRTEEPSQACESDAVHGITSVSGRDTTLNAGRDVIGGDKKTFIRVVLPVSFTAIVPGMAMAALLLKADLRVQIFSEDLTKIVFLVAVLPSTIVLFWRLPPEQRRKWLLPSWLFVVFVSAAVAVAAPGLLEPRDDDPPLRYEVPYVPDAPDATLSKRVTVTILRSDWITEPIECTRGSPEAGEGVPMVSLRKDVEELEDNGELYYCSWLCKHFLGGYSDEFAAGRTSITYNVKEQP